MKLKDYLNEAAVGDTILKQINVMDKWALNAWGAKNYVLLKDGIQFDVRGPKFKGRILIQLSKKDTYDVTAGNIRKMDWKVKKFVRDISVEQLVDVLNNIIG